MKKPLRSSFAKDKIFPKDSESIDTLDTSVRTENILYNANIKTIGALRTADLDKLPLTKKNKREIVEIFAEWGEVHPWAKTGCVALNRRMRAREAVDKLTLVERGQLFQDLGLCMCNRAIGYTTLVGLVARAVLEEKAKKGKKEKP